jgi:hypothetical protein
MILYTEGAVNVPDPKTFVHSVHQEKAVEGNEQENEEEAVEVNEQDSEEGVVEGNEEQAEEMEGLDSETDDEFYESDFDVAVGDDDLF